MFCFSPTGLYTIVFLPSLFSLCYSVWGIPVYCSISCFNICSFTEHLIWATVGFFLNVFIYFVWEGESICHSIYVKVRGQPEDWFSLVMRVLGAEPRLSGSTGTLLWLIFILSSIICLIVPFQSFIYVQMLSVFLFVPCVLVVAHEHLYHSCLKIPASLL